jgi:lipopolysaccharide transport system ATP-binding protein
MPTAIKFENISKQYRLGLVSTRTLSHDLNRWWQMNILRREDPYLKIGEVNDRAHKGNSEYVWALKDINFEVEQGDVVGIIGKNGAGKSTLLKILSKVTAPTTGSIKAKGRIASLLEVGTGFHPEMTGRENIYMNGAIMGMRKSEIDRKFDEIVDFAGVERYIDTPVKRYSSGMTVRLGFAVAAFLEPEILVVDEVLAVGDAEFQKKAIGKMQDVSKGEGRTVLFVSHNMGAIANLCHKSILLHNGNIINYNLTEKIITEYITFGKKNSGKKSKCEIICNNISQRVEFEEIRLIQDNVVSDCLSIDKEIAVEIEYNVNITDSIVSPSIHLLDSIGNCVFATTNLPSANIEKDLFYGLPLTTGRYLSRCIIPPNFLNNKTYSINVFLVPNEGVENMTYAEHVIQFSVEDTGAMRKEYSGDWWGLVRPKFSWNTCKIS